MYSVRKIFQWSYRSEKTYRRRLTSVHNCTECNKSFSLSAILSTHLRTHSGGKPHKVCIFKEHNFPLSWRCQVEMRVGLEYSLHTRAVKWDGVSMGNRSRSFNLDSDLNFFLKINYIIECMCWTQFPFLRRLQLEGWQQAWNGACMQEWGAHSALHLELEGARWVWAWLGEAEWPSLISRQSRTREDKSQGIPNSYILWNIWMLKFGAQILKVELYLNLVSSLQTSLYCNFFKISCPSIVFLLIGLVNIVSRNLRGWRN